MSDLGRAISLAAVCIALIGIARAVDRLNTTQNTLICIEAMKVGVLLNNLPKFCQDRLDSDSRHSPNGGDAARGSGRSPSGAVPEGQSPR